MYRCEASTIEGFIQQLAVSYVANGYWFYVAGTIPPGKDPQRVDAKLIEKYDINISKWTRLRRKRLGFANVQYLRYGQFFVLLASQGQHAFFREETTIRDVRRSPIRFAGYSVSYRRGRDARWHASVRIDAIEFRWLKDALLNRALVDSSESIEGRVSRLRFAPYSAIRNQYRQLVRAINRKRRTASLSLVPLESIPRRRSIVSPFTLPPPGDGITGKRRCQL